MSDFTPQGLSFLTCALEGVGMVTSFIKEAVVRVQRDKVCEVLNLQRLCVCARLASQGWSPMTCVWPRLCVYTRVCDT